MEFLGFWRGKEGKTGRNLGFWRSRWVYRGRRKNLGLSSGFVWGLDLKRQFRLWNPLFISAESLENRTLIRLNEENVVIFNGVTE